MRRLAICFVALAACSSGVRGLGDDRAPLATIHGRFDWPEILRRFLKNPRAGIIWAGVPVFVPYCHEYGPTALEPDRVLTAVARNGCRDPFEVVPGVVGPSVPLDLERDEFEIPLDHLPPSDAMVGTIESRVAYGSLVIFEDEDDDERLDFGSRCPRRDPGDPEPLHERLQAASFVRLNEQQTRITYVEGTFDADSFFYPHPNCTELPPPGFSIWSVGDLLDEASTCSVGPIDQLIEPSSRSIHQNLACWPSERDAYSRPPPDDGIATDLPTDCTDDGRLAVSDNSCPCPNLRIYALRGCYDDSSCSPPDWDVEAPEDWPCETQP